MATATPTQPAVQSVPTATPARASVSAGTYECECGHTLRVIGGGRHAVFFEPGNTRLDDPVLNRVCPACGRGLPGKGSAYA